MVTIYALTCVVNGKAYIGCTSGKIAKRFREHRCLLKSGTHNEPDLQADWILHGEQNFRMEEVFILEDGDNVAAKRAAETHAMQRFKALGCLYNRNEASFAPTRAAIEKSAKMQVNKGRKLSAWHIQRLRESQLGIPKNHGAKISATKKLRKQMMR